MAAEDIQSFEEEDADPGEAQAGSKKKLILFSLLGLVLLLGGTGGALYFTGVLGGSEEGDMAEHRPDPLYVPIEPSFTVNFQGKRGPRFLQISVEAMTRDPGMEEVLNRHMPVIRNNLVMLFGSQSADDLRTREGKERLQAETLAEIQKVLAAETGDTGIEAVYFTSLVMQ